MSLTQFFNRKKRKGQSAIEYLTTYGWAILAIVIAGAVILVLISNQGGTCPKTAASTVFSGDLQMQTWAFTGSNQIDLQFINVGPNSVTLNNVWADTNQDGTFSEGTTAPSASINSGGTSSVTLANVTGLSSGCNDFDLRLGYTVTGLTNPVNATGSLKGPL